MWENLTKALNDLGGLIRDTYADELSVDEKRATGDLIDTLDYIVVSGDDSFAVSLKMQDYWKYVEYDSEWSNYPPPYSKILQWVKVKNILPHPDKDGNLPTQEGLAWAIRHSIKENGIKGGHQLERTLDGARNTIDKVITDAIQKDIDEMINMRLIIGSGLDSKYI